MAPARCLALIVGVALALGRPVAAEPLDELKGASSLVGLDAQRLKNGEVISARGTAGDFAHGVYIESCFYVKAAPVKAASTLLQWDPSKHPQDEVAAYETFRSGQDLDFSRVAALNARSAPDRWMLEQTRAAADGKANELHLTLAEAAALRAAPDCATAWKTILQRRAEAVVAGGLNAAAGYLAGDASIAPSKELHALLSMTPKIAARFSGAEGANAFGYAERSLTQGHTSFALGTLSSRMGAESTQVVDCSYYSSDTYFLSTDLYELWPWEGGTLVWQIDYVSAPFRGYTHGLDKIFAGREMVKDTGKSIGLFRREAEK